jgi:hypothetical protein
MTSFGTGFKKRISSHFSSFISRVQFPNPIWRESRDFGRHSWTRATFVVAGIRSKTLGTFRIMGKAGSELVYGTLQAPVVSESGINTFSGIGISESGIGYTMLQPWLSRMSLPCGCAFAAVGLEWPRAYRATRKKRCSVVHGLAFSV